MNILGIGRWSDNWFLSFIEDTTFPVPFFQKVEPNCNIEEKTKFWKRRVDVNVLSYFTILAVFSKMNFMYFWMVSLFV